MSDENSSTGGNRRLHERFASTMRTACRPMGDSSSWLSRVLDVSRSGIGLQLGRHFKPGSLVSMELSDLDGRVCRTVIARVMRCHKLADGTWMAGCAFASELDDDELAAFSVQRVAAPASDQRAWVRTPCDLAATIRSAEYENATPVAVRIRSIAPGGVGMECPSSIGDGAYLQLEITDGPAFLIRVAAKKQFQDRWLVGAEFVNPLTIEELEALVQK